MNLYAFPKSCLLGRFAATVPGNSQIAVSTSDQSQR
eukprot:CAMPEP_0172772160 /NCGR_PEP_ID=MMETSP1074-20121228/191868_1 /TAXON_ID=2916 /ORGANISM="Ceratium fusus, Strain PA161109" /LENGTH=35 /DNA_ID= /DNA_START= /DNA_END= /DNA_ORIENTATION=